MDMRSLSAGAALLLGLALPPLADSQVTVHWALAAMRYAQRESRQRISFSK
jgi:hypothetical protein